MQPNRRTMTDSENRQDSRLKVLIVDDSRVIRKAVTTILSEQYTISEAQNGEEALLLLQQNQDFDAMLLDLWMPDVDGFEVLETLRNSSIAKLANMPIIIVTGHEDDVEMRERAETLGATDFIGKPFSAVDLRETVKKHIHPGSGEENNVVPFKPGPAKTAGESRHASKSDISAPDAAPVATANEIRAARRAYMQREGQRLLTEAIHQRKPMALLRMRVDKVKALLHRTGTEFTKRTLYRISKIIEGEIRRKDLLVRVGAAEFVILMPNSDPDEARSVAEAVFRVMRYTTFEYGELRFRLTVSSGLATPALREDLSFDQVQEVAESRTDQAAEAGGNLLVTDDEQSTKDSRFMTLDDANKKLRAGNTHDVATQLPHLLEQSLPLLVYANSSMELGISEALKSLINRSVDNEEVAQEK